MRKNTILLFGLGGTGKTVSIMSLLKIPGLKLRILLTDSNTLSGIRAGLQIHDIKLSPGQLIVMSPLQKTDNKKIFSQTTEDHAKYLKLSSKDLFKVEIDSNTRSKYQHFLDIQRGMSDFIGIDFFTKEIVNCGNIGDSTQWDTSCFLAIDGLTTISRAISDETLCGRTNLQIQDYGDIQNKLESFIYKLTTFTDCSVGILAHAKVADAELSAIETISVAIPGTALSGKLTGFFTNSIYCENIDGKRYWQGLAKGRRISISVRDIPEKEKLEPDFSKPEYTFFNDF